MSWCAFYMAGFLTRFAVYKSLPEQNSVAKAVYIDRFY